MFYLVLKINMLAYAINTMLVPFGSSFAKYFGYTIILTTFLLPFMEIRRDLRVSLRGEMRDYFFLILILVASTIISFPETSFDMEYIRALIEFVSLYWALSIGQRTYTQRDLRQLFAINKLLSLVFIIYTFVPFSFRYISTDEWGNMALNLGLGNPNSTAVRVMFSAAMLVIEIDYEKKPLLRIVEVVMLVGLIYVIYLTKCRTALGCVCAFASLIFFKGIPLKKWYIDVALLFMLAFIVVQLWLGTRSEVLFLGKSLTSGRQRMYASFIEEIKNQPLKYIFGSVGENRLANAHNIAFAVLLNMGLAGLIIYLAFWRKMIQNDVLSVRNNIVQKIAILSMLVYIIYSSTEAGALLGMDPLGTSILVIGRLAKDRMIELKCHLQYSNDFV